MASIKLNCKTYQKKAEDQNDFKLGMGRITPNSDNGSIHNIPQSARAIIRHPNSAT